MQIVYNAALLRWELQDRRHLHGAEAPAGMDMNQNQAFEYWAFISYSSKDRRYAQWLHRAIESYGVPARLIGHPTPWGEIPKRLRPVFFDREELPAAPNLSLEIEKSLRASRFLIVVCSPNSSRSRWVNREIEYFCQVASRDRVLALILRGEPNAGNDQECFPPALKPGPAEPLAADLRRTGDGYQMARLKLLAAMLGMRLGALQQHDDRERATRRRRLAVLSGIVTAVLASLVWYAYLAVQQRGLAEIQRKFAEDKQRAAEAERNAAEQQARRQAYIGAQIKGVRTH